MKYRIEISHHIPGFPNYQITREGRVKNILTNTYLKPWILNSGYYMIMLCNNPIRKKITIHRLVGISFIPNPDNLPEIDHINNDKLDNRVENLRWVTRSENSMNKKAYNILNEKFIYYNEKAIKKYYIYIKRCNVYKRFETFQEAIDYRDSVKEQYGLNY